MKTRTTTAEALAEAERAEKRCGILVEVAQTSEARRKAARERREHRREARALREILSRKVNGCEYATMELRRTEVEV